MLQTLGVGELRPRGAGVLNARRAGVWEPTWPPASSVPAGSLISFGATDAYGVWDVPSGDNYLKVVPGARTAIALKDDGQIAVWGSNQYGEVSNAPSGSDFVDIGGGAFFKAALRASGELVLWGRNDTSTNYIANLSGSETSVAAIAAGVSNGCVYFVRQDGTAGALGANNNSAGIPPAGGGFVRAFAGNDWCVFVREDGTVGRSAQSTSTYATLRADIDALPASVVDGISTYQTWGLVRLADGTVVHIGTPQGGSDAIPAGLATVLSVGTAREVGYALKADGTLVAWGSDANGLISSVPSVSFIAAPAGNYFGVITVLGIVKT